jgi:hypothetical protein
MLHVECADWTAEFKEDVYVAIRSLQRPERTAAVQQRNLQLVTEAFAAEGLRANVRVESYAPEEYWHLPPKS